MKNNLTSCYPWTHTHTQTNKKQKFEHQVLEHKRTNKQTRHQSALHRRRLGDLDRSWQIQIPILRTDLDRESWELGSSLQGLSCLASNWVYRDSCSLSLSVTVCHCLSLSVTVCHCLSLLSKERFDFPRLDVCFKSLRGSMIDWIRLDAQNQWAKNCMFSGEPVQLETCTHCLLYIFLFVQRQVSRRYEPRAWHRRKKSAAEPRDTQGVKIKPGSSCLPVSKQSRIMLQTTTDREFCCCGTALGMALHLSRICCFRIHSCHSSFHQFPTKPQSSHEIIPNHHQSLPICAFLRCSMSWSGRRGFLHILCISSLFQTCSGHLWVLCGIMTACGQGKMRKSWVLAKANIMSLGWGLSWVTLYLPSWECAPWLHKTNGPRTACFQGNLYNLRHAHIACSTKGSSKPPTWAVETLVK